MKKRLFVNEKGTIFLTTMISMFIMILMGGYVFQITTQDTHLIAQMKKSQQAQLIAEAGLARALSTLYTNWSSSVTASNVSLGVGTYSTSLTSSNGRNLVSCVSTVQGVQRTASAEVVAPGVSALDYFAAAGSSSSTLTINPGNGGSSSTISASSNIYGGANVSVNATNNYAGNIYAAGPNVNCNGICTGHGYANWKTVVGFPVVTTGFYQSRANTYAQYFDLNGTGTKTYNGLPASVNGGIIYVNGNIQINDTGSLQTTTASIIATGNITFGNSAKVKFNPTTNYPALMTINGNITFNSVGNSGGGGSLDATGLVYSGNNLTFGGNHDVVAINGTVLARGSLSMSFTSQTSLTASYVHQNPPGMLFPSIHTTITSYNQ